MAKEHEMLPECAEMFGKLGEGQETIKTMLGNHLKHEQERNDKIFWALVKVAGLSCGISFTLLVLAYIAMKLSITGTP